MTVRAIPGAIAAAVLGAGCLVHVDRVADPSAAFREARADAVRAAERGGAPHELALLAYDPGEGELVRVELPLWLVRRACEDGDFDLDLEDERGERLARKWRHRWRQSDLEDAGPGVLLEARDADDRVLIWLR